MVVIRDSFLWGMKTTFCQRDLIFQEVSCLAVAAEEMSRLVRPLEYYALLLFHMNTHSAIKGNPKCIKSASELKG